MSGWRTDRHVGQGEVRSLEQQRLVQGLRECTGEAVPEVEAGRVTALSMVSECGSRDVGLIDIDRDELNPGLRNEDPGFRPDRIVTPRSSTSHLKDRLLAFHGDDNFTGLDFPERRRWSVAMSAFPATRSRRRGGCGFGRLPVRIRCPCTFLRFARKGEHSFGDTFVSIDLLAVCRGAPQQFMGGCAELFGGHGVRPCVGGIRAGEAFKVALVDVERFDAPACFRPLHVPDGRVVLDHRGRGGGRRICGRVGVRRSCEEGLRLAPILVGSLELHRDIAGEGCGVDRP